MKALKIIGLAVLVIIVAAGIAAGGYFLATWHNSDKEQTKTSSNETTTTSAARPIHELTPAKPSALTTCNADELKLDTAVTNAAGAGTLALGLILTNIGERTCILGGFPGISLVNDNGNQIGKPADRAMNYTEATRTLKPNDQASITVTYSIEGNFEDGTCTDGATKVRVYPPNDTGYLSVAQADITAWCPGFETSPVQ